MVGGGTKPAGAHNHMIGRMPWRMGWLQYFVVVFAVLCSPMDSAESSSPELMWSRMPATDATISSTNMWENVRDMNMTVRLDNEAEVLVSYTVSVMAASATGGAIPGSSFFNTGVSLSSGQRSFLQLRLLLNDLPYRQSSSHASPSFSMEAAIDTLSGHAAVALGPGAHSVQLQWKMSGDGVSSWSSRPSAADGYISGRTMVATARHRYMWHTHADSLARIDQEGSWEDMPGASLSFVLQDTTTLRFLYSMTVRSDAVDVNEGSQYAPPRSHSEAAADAAVTPN
jgi:hypothetical protein